jgi:hypothetical protein
MSESGIPPKNSRQWVKNEKIINENPTLRAARDRSEGFTPRRGATHGGKGSARRGGNEQAYADNWERIFGGDRKNVNHRDQDDQSK